MNDLPSGWGAAHMSDVFNLYQPQTISIRELTADGPFPVFGANGIIGRYHSFNHADPEVLVTCRGATCGTVNVSEPNSWITGNAMVVHPVGDWCTPRFLRYLLSSLDFEKAISGTAIPQITRKSLSPIEVPIPPASEQERIVAAIDEQFTRLDAGVAALKRVRRNVKRMRAAVLEAAVKGRLVASEESPGVVDRDANRNLPLGWTIVSVREIAEVSGGITKNPKRVPRVSAIPFLRVANVMRDQLDLREVHEIEVFEGELERLRLRRGDLLVVEGNGSPDQIGRSALWDGSIDPCVHQNHLIRVRSGDKILPEYLNIFWNAPSSMATIQAAASSTSGLHTLSTGKIRNIQVALPPLSVQHQIIEEVDRQLSALSTLDQQLGTVEARGRVLRTATLATAFSGNLAPQDPTDEPASALLERIAAKRTTLNGLTSRQGLKRRVMQKEVTA